MAESWIPTVKGDSFADEFAQLKVMATGLWWVDQQQSLLIIHIW